MSEEEWARRREEATGKLGCQIVNGELVSLAGGEDASS
jgi:hypothetical protein